MRRVAATLLLVLLLVGCGSGVRSDECMIYALNTVINLTIYDDPSASVHQKRVKEIYQEVDSVCNAFMSNVDGNSLYDLNEKRSVVAGDTLVEVLRYSLEFMESTDGYFNPFIGRLSNLWKDAIKNGEIPSDEVISAELEVMNNTSLVIDGNTVTILGDGNLDLGGIAKGYATNKAHEYLKENTKYYLLNGGRSNIVTSSKVNDSFSVGLVDPMTHRYALEVNGTDLCIGVSSLENQMSTINGEVYHHLISPKSGRPMNIYTGVFLFGGNPLILDAYSTAMFSMSIDEAKRFSEEEGISVILYKDDIVYQSEGCRSYVKKI